MPCKSLTQIGYEIISKYIFYNSYFLGILLIAFLRNHIYIVDVFHKQPLEMLSCYVN